MHTAKRRLLIAAAAILTVALLAGETLGTPSMGTNAILDGAGGEIFIPLQPATSGTLGDPLGGGQFVGLNADTITLVGLGDTSSGSVMFELVFDISGEIGPGEFVDPMSAILLLTFQDLDFKPVVAGTLFDYREELELSFRADEGGASNAPLLIDATNYFTFSGGPPGQETNDVELTYEISLKDDLGVTGGQFTDMDTDKEFALLVKLRSTTLHLRNPSDTLRNTSENVQSNDFVFVGIPEPGTFAVIALGSAGLLFRRRRR